VAGVKRVEDLDAYKLAVALRRRAWLLTAREPVRRDFKFVAQLRDAVRGGPRNIAEGFSRFAPSESLQFLSYAKASVDEAKDEIADGYESGYFSETERDELLVLVRRTLAAIRGWMRYLESPAAKRAYEAMKRKRSQVAKRTDPNKPKKPKERNKPDEPSEPPNPRTLEP
jgi:four helix bundle protein